MAIHLLAPESLLETREPADYYLNPLSDEDLPIGNEGEQLIALLKQKKDTAEMAVTIESAEDQRQIFRWHITRQGSSFRVCFATIDATTSDRQRVDQISKLFL